MPTTIAILADHLTHVLLNAIVHHGTNTAVYSQFQQVATYAPHAISGSWPGAENVTPASILAALPSVATSITVANSVAVYARNCDRSDSILAMPDTFLVGNTPIVERARNQFKADLLAIAATIEARSTTRILPWVALHPQHICSSNLV